MEQWVENIFVGVFSFSYIHIHLHFPVLERWKNLNLLLNGQDPLFLSFPHFLVA